MMKNPRYFQRNFDSKNDMFGFTGEFGMCGYVGINISKRKRKLLRPDQVWLSFSDTFFKCHNNN